MNRRVFVLSALALSSCATAGPPHVKAGPVLSELEPLYRANAGKDALIVSVASNGCTAKGDFVGGADIVREMFQSGELKPFLSEQGVLAA